jgi:hypothetical protein
MKKLRPHLYAKIAWTDMDEQVKKELRKNIKTDGLSRPLLLLNGLIVSGQNRYEILLELERFSALNHTVELLRTDDGDIDLEFVLSADGKKAISKLDLKQKFLEETKRDVAVIWWIDKYFMPKFGKKMLT